MIIRIATIGGTSPTDPIRCDLPSYSMIVNDPVTNRALVIVPDADVPSDVATFVQANHTPDISSPLPTPFPTGLAKSWREHLARRYDLGQARWNPTVA
jgi:hypothetical protein